MKKTLLSIATFLISFTTTFGAHHESSETTEIYKIDPVHSSVKFSIRHFVSKTTGSFGDFEGMLNIDRADLSNSSVEATVKIPSVDTDSKKRDAHLQKDEYFNAKEHPLMTFKSTKWEDAGDNKFKVTGDLGIRGVTREVVLDVELLGFGDGMRGAYLSGWEATTTLDRTEWGITGGQPAVGNDVAVTINVEAIRQ